MKVSAYSSFFLLLGYAICFLPGCMRESSMEPPDTPPVPEVQMIAPFQVWAGTSFPVVVRTSSRPPRDATPLQFDLEAQGVAGGDGSLVVRHGAGSTQFQASHGDTARFLINGRVMSCVPTVDNDSPSRHFSDAILSEGDLIWDAGTIIHLTGTVTIPMGSRLTLRPGTLVLLDANSRLRVEGELSCEGVADSVILFAPFSPAAPWGEIEGAGGFLSFEYTILTGGGGDDSRAFGHSGSQPVIRCTSGELNCVNLFLLDNPGKAFGTGISEITLDSCIVSRCDTGGEFLQSLVQIDNSYFLEMPNADGEAADDDNDALYLNSVHPFNDRFSRITDSIFAIGKDDGIDHNGARVVIEHCVIEGFANEGIACSNQNRVEVLNTLVRGCGQGIEAGYGSPEVVVDHCLLIDNRVGFRFGDKYTWQQHTGTLTVTNSIAQSNATHNVLDYLPELDGPSGAIDISWSMVQDTLYNHLEGNIAQPALFTLDYLLASDSPGRQAASDGLDIGLLANMTP